MKDVVLFDLDGTIIDSKPGIFRSASYALKQLGLPMPSEAEMMAFLGPPLAEGFENVCHVPRERLSDAVRLYREYYTNGGMFEALVYEGVEELLQVLRAYDKRCFVTTSKPQVYAQQILERFQISHLFDGVYGCELDGRRSHKADVVSHCLEQQGVSCSDAVLIGDRHFDVNGAKELHMPCIGVLYGYGSKEELVQAGAFALCESALDLLEILL